MSADGTARRTRRGGRAARDGECWPREGRVDDISRRRRATARDATRWKRPGRCRGPSGISRARTRRSGRRRESVICPSASATSPARRRAGVRRDGVVATARLLSSRVRRLRDLTNNGLDDATPAARARDDAARGRGALGRPTRAEVWGDVRGGGGRARAPRGRRPRRSPRFDVARRGDTTRCGGRRHGHQSAAPGARLRERIGEDLTIADPDLIPRASTRVDRERHELAGSRAGGAVRARRDPVGEMAALRGASERQG